MKIIHCADFHLDSKMEGLSAEKSKIRREELFLTFEKICEYASNIGAKVVIIAGDLFDSEKIFIKSQSRIMHVISRYPNVDFLYLSGNHDKLGIDANKEDVPSNFKPFGEWGEFTYEKVKIYGCDSSENSKIYAKNFDPNFINILALHGQVISHAGNISNDEISLPLLKGKNINYLALGHVHKFTEGRIDGRGKYVYCGAVEGRGFDETGEKGIVEIDVEKDCLSYKFIPCARREISEIFVSCDNFNTWFECKDFAINSVKKLVKDGSIIRVIFTGKRRFEIDGSGIALELSDRYFSVKILDKTEFLIDEKDYLTDKSALGEFVRLVLESDMENLTKNRVIMCGIKALKGEEI